MSWCGDAFEPPETSRMPPVARQQAGPRESGAPLLACSGRSCYARCASACAALAHSDAQPQAPPGGQDTEETLKQACLQGYPEGARCVQSSVDSRNSAIHSAYRISLRPSSLPEPRHPSLEVVFSEVRAQSARKELSECVVKKRCDKRWLDEKGSFGQTHRPPRVCRPAWR